MKNLEKINSISSNLSLVLEHIGMLKELENHELESLSDADKDGEPGKILQTAIEKLSAAEDHLQQTIDALNDAIELPEALRKKAH